MQRGVASPRPQESSLPLHTLHFLILTPLLYPIQVTPLLFEIYHSSGVAILAPFILFVPVLALTPHAAQNYILRRYLSHSQSQHLIVSLEPITTSTNTYLHVYFMYPLAIPMNTVL